MTSSDNPLCVQLTNVDNSDSDDDDAFTFQKRSFGKRSLTTNETPVKSKISRKRKQGSVGREQQREALNRKSRETLQKVLKIAADSDTEPDDDSDIEVTGSTKKPPVPPPAPAAPPINILDDSSDDEDIRLPPGQTSVYSLETSGASKEACQTLLKARTAKLELEKAQNYHAEDIYVPLEGSLQAGSQYSTLYRQGGTFANSGLSSVSTGLSLFSPGGNAFSTQLPVQLSRTPATLNTSTNLGPTLKVTLRSVNVIDGKKSPPTSNNQTIRKNEHFEALKLRFLAAKLLAPSSTQVTMKFDGQAIDMNKTPAFYDMDDEDMIDCEIRITAPVAAAVAAPFTPTPGRASLGPTLKITLRSVSVTDGKRSAPTCDQQTIRKNEQFEALLSRYLAAKNLNPTSTHVIMKFDGKAIAMNKTPAMYDMDDEDMIDCEIKVTAPAAAVAAAPTLTYTTPANVGGRSCRLKLVTSTKKARQPAVEVLTIKVLHTVQVLVEQYKAARKLAANAKVSLKFDGELMNVGRTIVSYGVDDDDQIDVIVK